MHTEFKKIIHGVLVHIFIENFNSLFTDVCDGDGSGQSFRDIAHGIAQDLFYYFHIRGSTTALPRLGWRICSLCIRLVLPTANTHQIR